MLFEKLDIKFISYNCEYVLANNSIAILLLAYGELQVSIVSVSENGNLLFNPYTLLLLAYTICLTLFLTASSNI